MRREHVDLLNTGGDIVGYHQRGIAPEYHGSAGLAGRANGRQSLFSRFFQCFEHVRTVSAGRDPPEDVPRISESFDLTGKNTVKAVVIPDGGQDRGICREGDGRKRAALVMKSPDKFRSDVLRVCSAASIAADEDLVTGAQGFSQIFAISSMTE